MRGCCSTPVARWGHWWLSHPEAPEGVSRAQSPWIETGFAQCMLCSIAAFLRPSESLHPKVPCGIVRLVAWDVVGWSGHVWVVKLLVVLPRDPREPGWSCAGGGVGLRMGQVRGT